MRWSLMGDELRLFMRESDKDSTVWQSFVPHTRFTVFPEWEWFDGLEWPDGAVFISVEGQPECDLERESSGGFFNGNFPKGCDVAMGDTVTFTDGITTRMHEVRNLAVTRVDKDEKRLQEQLMRQLLSMSGRMTPGSGHCK